MKILKIKKTLFLSFFLLFQHTQINCNNINNNSSNDFNIRVLLEEKESISKSIFTIETSKDSKVTLQSPNLKQKIHVEEEIIEIIIKDNNIYITLTNPKTNLPTIKKTKSKEVELIPEQKYFKVNGKAYEGKLKFKIDEMTEKLFIINTLPLDDYLYSVLISESYQTWPMEVQKVHVVVFRSYAIHYLLNSRKNKTNQTCYDLKRTNFHQTYNGMHNYVHLKQAIEETKDLVLTHNNKVILAMFDACCGGIIPSKMNVLDFKKAPYLARPYPCNFCKKYALYKWHKEIDVKEFIARLKNNPKTAQKINELGALLNIYVKTKDQAGIIHEVKLFGSNKNIKLSGVELWETFRDKIKSLNFDIKKRRHKILIDGNGFGHQIGLCQRGARELVKLGWNFKRILKYYYPKTKFAKLHYAKI